MFFSRTNRRFRPLHIIAGEFIGFTVLVAISLSGFVLGRYYDSAWLGLLGLMPITIGINALLARGSQRDDGPAWLKGMKQEQDQPGTPRRSISLGRVLRDRRTYQVSAVTVANGGNNIAIYLPLFASCSLPRLTVILLICYAAIGLWCFNSWFLIRQPHTAVVMSRLVSRVAPFVLIYLGISILARSGTTEAIASVLTAST